MINVNKINLKHIYPQVKIQQRKEFLPNKVTQNSIKPIDYTLCATLKSKISFKGANDRHNCAINKFEELTQEELPSHTKIEILNLKNKELERIEKILNNEIIVEEIKKKTSKINFLLCIARENEKFDILLEALENRAKPEELYCVIRDRLWNNYQDLIKNGENPKYASILASIQGLKKHNIGDYKKIIDFVDNFKLNETRTSFILNQYLREIKPKNLHKIANYVEKIDIENLKNLIGENYTQSQILEFVKFHSSKSKKADFTKEKLTFLPNLTEFLKTFYVDAKNLDKVLSFYPQTPRNIGEIPADWLDKTEENTEKIQEEIYLAIKAFTNSKNTEGLSARLSKILNKETRVNKLGEGFYGLTYTIDVGENQKYCLKIFKKERNFERNNHHGEFIEPQIALYANKHYGDDFAKFYFGNLGHYSKKDNKGFMVVEFLDKNSRKKENNTKEGKYTCCDVSGNHNKINNIIYDFGAIYPRDNFGKPISSWSIEE